MGEEAIDRVRETFERWVADGRGAKLERWHGPAGRAALRRLVLGPASRFLDVGCGSGWAVRWAAERLVLGKAVGLDLSPSMVALARELSADLSNVDFRVSAFPEHDLGDERFDAAFSMEALYYLPDLCAGLDALRALLVPGGQLACVVDYYRENEASRSWPEEIGCPMHCLGEAEWREAFEDAGFAVRLQERIRREPSGDADGWEQREGSLLTLGVAR